MADESDGIGEALDEHMRVAVAAAAQIGEHRARARAERARAETAQAQAQAQQLRDRQEAARRVDRLDYADVENAEWWDRADPDTIARAYASAHAWANEDPEAARAQEKIEAELRDRYSIDTTDIGANPAAVRDAVAEQTRAEDEAGQAAGLAVASHGQDQRIDEAHTAPAAENADALADRYSEDNAAMYDSAEARATRAAALSKAGVPEQAAEAHMLADLDEGAPATAATRGSGPGRAPAAKRGNGPRRRRAAELSR